MNKLLIICDMFPPAFAPRMGYLCKYLKREGWELTVVTEYIPDQTFSFLEGNANVTYIHYYKAKGKITKRFQWLYIMILDFLFHYKDRKIVKICTPLIKMNDFQGILCSTYRTFPLLGASWLAKKNKIPFVADLRDIIEQYSSNEYISHNIHTFKWLDNIITNTFRNRLLKDRNKALKIADCITTISPWHVGVLRQFNPTVKLIYNGFDPDIFYPEQIKTSKFTITYTGRLLSLAIRNPDLLFKAIYQLSSEQLITPATFQVVWYTDKDSRSIIESEAKRMQVIEFMVFHNYVPASEIPNILNRSSILLTLTNKSDDNGPKGVMTTKFFESLAVEKPILCVRSDEALLAHAIQENNAGLAATNVDEVYQFIKHYYERWKKDGFTKSDIEKQRIAIYSRKEQAIQFATIFKEISKNG